MKKILSLMVVFQLILAVAVFVPAEKVSAAASENLALGAKVVRAARYGWEGGIFLPEWLIDGDYNTIWASYYSAYTDIPSNEKFRHLVEFDLGKEQLIGSIVVTSRPNILERSASANLEIHLSNDRNFKDYVVVGSVDGNGLGLSESVTFTVPKGYSYRYFRVVKTVHSVLILSEIEVYGAAFDPNQLTSYTDVNDNNLNDAVNVSQMLNIADNPTDNEFGANKLITRGEAVQWLSRAAKYSESEGETSFKDIEDSPYAAAIKGMEERGILSKSEKFNPEAYISYNEFLAMATRILGYEPYSKVHGGYPLGVQESAKQAKLLKSVSVKNYNECVNRADAIKIIYQMLIAPTFGIAGMDNDGADYRKEDTKFIDNVYGYDIIKGQITASDSTGLYDENAAESKGNVRIGNESYRDSNNSLWKYIGKRVTALVDKNDNNNIVLNAWIDNEEKQVTTMYGTDVVGFSGNTLTYEREDGKNKKIKMDTGYAVIKNYVAYPSFADADIEKDRVRLELIDANDNGDPDVIFIYDAVPIVPLYKDISLDSVHVGQADDNTLSSDYDVPTRIDAEELKHVHIQQGEDFLLPAGVIEPELLMIYKSDNNKVIGINVFKDVVSGIVTGAETDGVYVDNEFYEFSPYYPTAYINKIKLGDAVSFVTDETGKIVRDAMKNDVAQSDELAFLIAGGMKEDLNYKVTYKLFNESGKMLYLNLAEKVRFTDVYGTTSKKNGYEVYNILKTGKQLANNIELNNNGAFIRYKLNSKGEISDITCQTLTNAKSKRYYCPSSRAWTNSKWGTEYLYLSNPDTTVFNIPFNADTGEPIVDDEFDSYYSISTVNDTFKSDYTKYNTELYLTTDETDLNKKSVYTDFVAYYKEYSFDVATSAYPVDSLNSTKILYKSSKQILNADNTASTAITGYNISTGKEVTLTLHPSITKVIDSNKVLWAKKRGESGTSSLYQDYNLLAAAQVKAIPAQYVSDLSDLKPGDILACSMCNDYVSGFERILQSDEIDTCESDMESANFYFEVGENLGTMAANYKLINGRIGAYNNNVLKISNDKHTIMTEYNRIIYAFTVDKDGKITKEDVSAVPAYWTVGDNVVISSNGVGGSSGAFSIINYK